MFQKRHLERRETLAYWPAMDTDKGKTVGLVTDLNVEGIRIHSKHAFKKGKTINMRIAVDSRLCGSAFIPMTVKNIWCRPSGVPDIYHSGFKIIDITEPARKSILKFIQAFSYLAPGSRQRGE